MKKILLTICLFCSLATAQAQTCPDIQGLMPIVVRLGIGAFGPESAYPTIPLYWNRFYKLNELTGVIEPTGCTFTGDPNLHEVATCVCYLTGSYFRKVSDLCDLTPCGGDASLTQLPITNNNDPNSNWSQGATWVGGQVPNMSSSLSVVITKSTQIDADLSFPANQWLILTAGSSSILAGNTVTDNSVIQVYQAAQLENFGTLKGSGQITGSLLNSGTLAPGNSPGKFTIVGNYTASSAAVHQMEIASAALYDTISVVSDPSTPVPSGNAALNGVLQVSLINGFVPALGDTFRIFSFSSSTGVFAGTSLPVLPAGLYWNVHYNPDNLSLAVVNTAPLPLTFTGTRASRKDDGVLIEWDTELEDNVKNYEVERSTDGIYFEKVGTVKAVGTDANHYSWFDEAPANGNNFYRIRAVDIDGKFRYTGVLAIRINDTRISVYPNPVKRGGSLQLDLADRKASKIEIVNVLGQVLYTKEGKLTGTLSISVPASWAAGRYLVRMVTENKVATHKIIVY
ncbi:MAG TPA: T9SS type A sorting domain-containing protein [Puia sp.]|nr:T9SS type A sorting domain-containing protein [Puia sp.]